jgi:gas vesicle protein
MRKMMHIFLIGMLLGVMITAAFTYLFAIPANSDRWRWEIWQRGGAAWTMDMKNGHRSWKWLVEPIPDTPPKKPVIVPSAQKDIRTEHL